MQRSNGKQTGVRVRLVGEDGNAFAIMGRVRQAMKRARVPRETIDAYTAEATSGDYYNLLKVTLEYVTDASTDGWNDEDGD